MTDRESCIILNMISGIGFVKYNALCGHFGSPSAALNAPAEKLAQVRGIGVQLSERLSTWRESCDLAGELSRAERGGVRIITLVDDDYPAENFNARPEGDGAFICQNSWGTEFGDGGIFYVSYYDANIGNYNVAYTGTEPADNYDILHQSDLLGWCGQLGYNSEEAYFANVYEAEEAQEIRAAGFYATGEDTEYRLAVIPDFQDPQDLSGAQFTQSGYLQYAGYYTIELETPVPVEAGERFAVLVQIRTPDSQYPIAVEFASGELAGKITLEDGEGYISADGGMFWERVETAQDSNLCLKVYADREGST